MKTVATLPGAFYLLQCAALFTSLVLLMFVRLRRDEPQGDADSLREAAQSARHEEH